MRRTFTLILFALMLLVPLAGATAQFTDDAKARPLEGNGIVYHFTLGIDSLETYTSKAFNLNLYDGEDLHTYPIAYGKVFTSVWGKPRVDVYLEGTYGDGNWFRVDTLATADSVETYNIGTVNLNNIKAAAYRVVFEGATNNHSDVLGTLSLMAYRRDDYPLKQ